MSISADTDLWGQDIALDVTGQARVSAGGELILSRGVETGVQDIRLRLFTRLGSLFYDTGFGSLIHDWILEENTLTSRLGLCAEITMRIEADPRVQLGSVRTELVAWDEKGLTVLARFSFIDQDQPLNLVLQYDKIINKMVISDVQPHDSALALTGQIP